MSAGSATELAESTLLPMLPPLQRLALAYAPASARAATLALLAFDNRLASIVRAAREPMLAQLRLAWWRDRLREPDSSVPKGEPVLGALSSSGLELNALVPLVDGWEAMIGDHPLEPHAFTALAHGRGLAFAALANALHQQRCREAARDRARSWALADIAARVSSPEESRRAAELARTETGSPPALPRALRPLAIMEGVARRQLRRGVSDPGLSRGDMLAAMRLGIFGR